METCLGSPAANLTSEIETFGRALARRKANELVGHYEFTLSDKDDIEQELLLGLWQRAAKFDPTKTDPQSFISLVVKREVAALIRQRTRKRQLPLHCESLNDEVDEADDGDELPSGNRDELQQTEMRDDIATVVARLTPEQQRICDLLKEHSISDAARILQMPRGTLTSKVFAIRKLFVAADLGDYL